MLRLAISSEATEHKESTEAYYSNTLILKGVSAYMRISNNPQVISRIVRIVKGLFYEVYLKLLLLCTMVI